MDRRLVLVGLAAATAAPAALIESALAQTSAPTTASPAGQAAGQMSQAEQQWLQQTMAVGAVALETSRIALQKAQEDDLKQFAKFEVDEQQGLAEVLKSMQDGAMAGGTAANTTGSAAAPAMDAKHREMVDKLQKASGAAFDKDYHKGQVQGHQELLQLQENFIKSGSRNREAVNVAKLARGHIKEHLQVLADIEP